MCQHWPTTSCWVTLNMSLWECVSLRARLTLGGPIIVPFQRVSVMSSSSSRPQLQVPSPIPFWPSSSSSRSRKFRGTFTPGEVIETHTYQLWTGHLCSDKRASRQIQNEAQGILRSEGVPFGLFALKKKEREPGFRLFKGCILETENCWVFLQFLISATWGVLLAYVTLQSIGYSNALQWITCLLLHNN